MKWIWLDDLRIPIQNLDKWIICKNYDEFVNKVTKIGLNNIELFSFDHDLGDLAMQEFFRSTKLGENLNYDNIKEKTGYDCAKWLINLALDQNILLPSNIYVHSANPVGSDNIIKLINNYFKHVGLLATCKKIVWQFIIPNEN